MNNDEKSIAYAFIANGVQIYLNDEEDFFLVSKLICDNCGNSWYMNLTECFLCGAKNSFLYRCSKCGKFQSITKSSNRCSNCGSDNLFMVCPNPECISNKDSQILKESNNYGGVLNKNSGLIIAQHYCLNCGSNFHRYKNYRIYVRKTEKDSISFKDLQIDSNKISESSFLILKWVKKGAIKYGLYKIGDIVGKTVNPNNLYEKFSDMVSVLYPIGKAK